MANRIVRYQNAKPANQPDKA